MARRVELLASDGKTMAHQRPKGLVVKRALVSAMTTGLLALFGGVGAVAWATLDARPVEVTNPSVDRVRSMGWQIEEDSEWFRRTGEPPRSQHIDPGSPIPARSWEGVTVTDPGRPTQPAFVVIADGQIVVDATGGAVRVESSSTDPATMLATVEAETTTGTTLTPVCMRHSAESWFSAVETGRFSTPTVSVCYFRTAEQLAEADWSNTTHYIYQFAPFIAAGGMGLAAVMALLSVSIERFRGRVHRAATADTPDLIENPRPNTLFGGITSEVNRSLARAKTSVEQQRRFVADAAHELRSPLTTLITTLEVAERHPQLVDPIQVNRTSLAQARRLERLTQDLLLLAQLDARTPLRRDEVDLADVVREVATDSSDPGRPITLDITGPVPAVGDRDGFRRILQNLIDNAIRHAATGVSVTLATDEGTAAVTVTNDGDPIPDERASRIFDRFTRLDEARNHHGGGGSGLGLAIALELAERYGGGLDLERGRQHGASFTWQTPLAR